MSVSRGELQLMSTIHNLLPEFVPRLIASGIYKTIPDTHFFLVEFREMTDDISDCRMFAALLPILRQKCLSPTGKGRVLYRHVRRKPGPFVALEDSWEAFFAKTMIQALDLEIEGKVPSEKLDVLSRALFEKVVPRLLGPLESDGRIVKCLLVHGDLLVCKCRYLYRQRPASCLRCVLLICAQ